MKNDKNANGMGTTKNSCGHNVMPIILGIVIGILLGVIIYSTYVLVFHENGPEFYLFTGLALLGGPVTGGSISALMAKEHRPIALHISGSIIFASVLILWIVFYVILPLVTYDSVQVPADCIGNASNYSSHIPPDLNYPIPGIGTGTMITGDNNTAVIVVSDHDRFPFVSTVYIVHKNNSEIIRSLRFDNDIIAAAIDGGTLYVFNDKILYTIDTKTGADANNIVKIDNYRGLYTAGNNTYMQTTFEISILKPDGSVLPHRRMNMSCMAYGCVLSTATA